MSKHSVLAPSSAHRRIRCPGSLAACKGIESPPSEYAAEGTAYHEVAADVLACNDAALVCADWVGKEIDVEGFTFMVDAENATHAQSYVDYVHRIPGKLFVEIRLDTSPIVGVDGQGGTGDAIVLDYGHKTIHVVDLKFGRGEVVYAKDNEQLLEYGAAALSMYGMLADWQYVRVHIVQPRIGHYDDFAYAVADVRAWAHGIQPIEQQAYRLWENGTAKEIRAALVPGEKQCRWCPIKGSCPARSEAMLKEFPVTTQSRPELTDAQLAEALNRTDDLEDWCRAIRGEALARATAGRHLPGWKIVVGRKGARQWANAALAESTLHQLIGVFAYKPPVVISPTEAEKQLKRFDASMDAAGLDVTQADGKPSLARIEDKREALAVGMPEFGITQESAV